jgi:hypothetical protein
MSKKLTSSYFQVGGFGDVARLRGCIEKKMGAGLLLLETVSPTTWGLKHVKFLHSRQMV